MPDYGGNALAQAGTSAGESISSALFLRAKERRRQEAEQAERDRKKRADKFMASLVGLNRPDNPDHDIYQGIEAGEVDWENGKQALAVRKAQREEQAAQQAAQQAQRTELDMSLANRAVEDPNVSRMNLDMPEFRPMPANQPAPRIPGGEELPNMRMANRFGQIAEKYPGMAPDSRIMVGRDEINPGPTTSDVAARQIQMYQQDATRQKTAGEQQQREITAQQIKDPNLRRMYIANQITEEQAGLIPQQYAPVRPSYDRQLREQEAARRGLQPNTPEWFDFVMKESGGVTETQERSDAKELAYAKIEEQSYEFAKSHNFDYDPEGTEKLRKRWVLDERIKWMEANARSTDPLAAEMKELLSMKAQLLQDYESLMAE